LAFGFAALLLTNAGCRSSKPEAVAAQPAPTNPPAPYLRIAQPRTNLIELQIALREFVPATRSQPKIWLAAVSHVGDSNYYARLQQHLDGQDLVLYEGITDRASRLQKRKQPSNPEPDTEETSIQNTMAESLGLAFQLTSIDYSSVRFQNSDLTIEELQRLIAKETPAGGRQSKTANEFQKLLAMMEGDGLAALVMHAGLRLIGSSPKLRALARLMMIETLGRFSGNLAEFEGLPPEWKRLVQILIDSRNDAVLRDVQTALAKRNAPKSIAIFYGAAHMDNFERRIISEFNYRPGRVHWLPAFSVDLQKSRLTPAEVEMIRGFVSWQMDLVRQKE
jgi:hypothetical protein